mgnify:CR=1 FL=1
MKSIIKKSISLDYCKEISELAVKKAEELGMNISLTIVDSSGVIKYFISMDNAPLISIDASKKKAITAIGFGMPTGESWYNFIKDDGILLNGVNNLKDFILLGGGSPINDDDGNLIGAIGISGGHYSDDEKCVEAALK